MKIKLGTLHYDTNSEEGEVKWADTVDLTRPDVVMLDILGDWVSILTAAYDDMHKIIYPTEENNDADVR